MHCSLQASELCFPQPGAIIQLQGVEGQEKGKNHNDFN